MLSIAEELLLLTLDDEKGCFTHLSPVSLEFALSGAVLMDLALRDKLDTDLKNLILIDNTHTGDEIFDTVIDLINEHPNSKNALYWVREIKNRCINLKQTLIKKLIDKGILEKKENRFLWVFKQRRYPIIDNKEKKEVKTRIRDIVLSNEIPDPEDIVIISLVSSCNLLDKIFTQKELNESKERILAIAKMDLIGQAVSKAINQFMEMVTYAVANAT